MTQYLYVLQNDHHISLVNIHHHTVTICFLVMRTFKIYSLSNLPIYNTVLLTIVTILYIISPRLMYLVSGSWYPLILPTHFTFTFSFRLWISLALWHTSAGSHQQRPIRKHYVEGLSLVLFSIFPP